MGHIPTSRDLAVLVAAVAVIHVAGRLLYNIFLHPLRGYPGPLLWRSSSVPKAIHILLGTYGRKTVEFHDRYGPALRVAPDELAFNGAQARIDIIARPLKEEFSRNTLFIGADIVYGYGLVTAPAEIHPRMRRIFSRAFSSSSVQEHSELIVAKHVNSMIGMMGEVCGGEGTLNLMDMLNFVVYDVMAEVTFGESLKLLETGEHIPWMRIMVTARKFVVFRAVFLGLPVLGPLLEALTAGPMKRRMKEHCLLSEDMVRKRMEQKKLGHSDIWSFVLDEQGSEKGLTIDETYANGAMMPLAGESPAIVLTGILYYTLANSAIYAKLTDEIRTTFSDSRDITVGTVSGMAYLDAVIQEGMRVYPPGPVGIGRFVPDGGAEISGKHVPAGTLVTWNVLAASISPAHFHRPREFIPERWLEPRDPIFGADCREIHEPFGRGPRSCIGKHLAMLEMRIILAKLFWHFDMELCDGMEGWLDQRSYLTWEKRPLMVKVREVGISE